MGHFSAGMSEKPGIPRPETRLVLGGGDGRLCARVSPCDHVP